MGVTQKEMDTFIRAMWQGMLLGIPGGLAMVAGIYYGFGWLVGYSCR